MALAVLALEGARSETVRVPFQKKIILYGKYFRCLLKTNSIVFIVISTIKRFKFPQTITIIAEASIFACIIYSVNNGAREQNLVCLMARRIMESPVVLVWLGYIKHLQHRTNFFDGTASVDRV